MFSQNNEEQIISDYFGDKIGRFISLGENDGTSLSNVRALAVKGWSGVCVEPSKEAFKKLSNLYKGNRNVQCLNFAVTDYSGVIDFYQSGAHLGLTDTDLISTTEPAELVRWKGTSFKKSTAKCLTFADLLKQCKFQYFDFLSIDIEGSELKVLPQIDFDELGIKLACVEYNGKNKPLFDSIFKGYKLIHQNAENLIYGK